MIGQGRTLVTPPCVHSLDYELTMDYICSMYQVYQFCPMITHRLQSFEPLVVTMSGEDFTMLGQ